MISRSLTTLALRARAVATVVASTGSVTLTATTTGYTRSDGGSFLTDGIYAGMEITPSGFSSNPVDVATIVTATSITTKTARAAEASGSGRSITVSLPAARAWENERFTKPTGLKPYVEEAFAPGGGPQLITLPASSGQVEETGLYVLRLYGLAVYGILGLNAYADALRAQFAPGTSIAVGSGSLYIRTDLGPQAGQILPVGDSYSVLTLSFPWKVRTTNAIAA